MPDLFSYLEKGIRVKHFIGALLIYLFFATVVMPGGAKYIQDANGCACLIFDLQYSYSFEQASKILSCYTNEGIKSAILFSLIADTLYPLSYSFLFICAFILLIRKTDYKLPVDVRYIVWTPIATLCIDLFENMNVNLLMWSYPNITETQVFICSVTTSTKWTMVGLLFIILFYLFIRKIFSFLRF